LKLKYNKIILYPWVFAENKKLILSNSKIYYFNVKLDKIFWKKFLTQVISIIIILNLYQYFLRNLCLYNYNLKFTICTFDVIWIQQIFNLTILNFVDKKFYKNIKKKINNIWEYMNSIFSLF